MTNHLVTDLAHINVITRCLGSATVAVLTMMNLTSPLAAADFYAGKQITFIASGGVGGGYDLLARITARHLGKHIPGNPTFIVQNMASGGLVAPNYMFSTAPKDGTTIALVQRTMLLALVTHASGVRFELEKFNWLGSLNSETGVTLTWHTAPHKTANDLFDKELIVSSVGAGADNEATPKLYNSLLGTRFKVITGYSGTPQMALAMERGEVHGIGDWAWSSVKATRPDWLRDNKITLLMQGALSRNPELGNVPFALDLVKNDDDRKVLELYFTQKTAARPLIAPPGVPADRVQILRKAFAALAHDNEFAAEAERSRLEFDFVPGEAVDKIIALISAAPSEMASRIARALGPTQ